MPNQVMTRQMNRLNIQTRPASHIARPTVANHYATQTRNGQPLSISRELQMKVYELHMQIQRELGDVKYALLGNGQAAVLVGTDNDTINNLCPQMNMLPDNPRQALPSLPYLPKYLKG